MTRHVLISEPGELNKLLELPLDDAQLRAATAPLTTGLVVAGAGSGKTSVMAARVVWLVASGAVAPDRVLGLTFTNKAAAELSQRVRGSLRRAGLGPDLDADGDLVDDSEPTVSTYHAFAGRVVRDHGLRVGVEPDSRLITQATRYMLALRAMRDVEGTFDELTVEPRFVADRMLSLAGELNEHLVDLDRLRRFDRDLIERIGAVARPTKAVLGVAGTARQRLELSRLVEAYLQAKRSRDLVDFDDQIALAARVVGDRPEVVEAYRNEYAVVLLDEYQDTSVGQRVLLTRLFGDGHPVTAVGDPFQAIYGWRGASVANIDEFPLHFARADGEPAATYQLETNYRSGGRLLAVANALSAPLRAIHRDAVELRVPPGSGPDQGAVRCAVATTATEELDIVVDEVQRAHEGGVAPWHEIAVLVRQTSVIAPLHERLTAARVPVEVVGLRGLLGLPGVADVVATLEVVSDPVANAALLRLLAGARWQIGPRDLRLLGRQAARLAKVDEADDDTEGGTAALARALDSAVADTDPAELVSLLDALETPGDWPYSAEARQRFAALAAELEELRERSGEALVDLVHRVISTSGLDVEAAARSAGRGTAQLDALAALLDVAAAFRDLDGESTLASFLAYLDAAQDEEGGLDQPTPTFGDSVKLMTIHRAKGLEWDVVVLPELTATVFPSGRGRSRYTQSAWVMPPVLRGDAHRLPEVGSWSTKGLDDYAADCKADDALEEGRLGYVAITRAKKLLVVTTAWWGATQKRLRGPSAFFDVVRERCEADGGVVVRDAPRPVEEENPAVADLALAEVAWPVELDKVAAAGRREAAEAVARELAALAGATWPPADPPPIPTDLGGPARHDVERWDHDLGLLLGELAATYTHAARAVPLPSSLSASRVLQLNADPDGLAAALARPMPRAPSAAARRGTRFHAWVEARYAQQPLLSPDELPGAGDAAITDEDDLANLQAAFERGPYADRVPLQLEVPFSLVLAGRVVRGRIDAVYSTDDGYEVVDWKTNRAHDADPLQLAIYRLAWAEIIGCPLGSVTASFAYVRDGAVVTPPDLLDRTELEALLSRAG